MTPVVYDCETYPNLFSLTACSLDRDDMFTWEISPRRDDRQGLWEWLRYLQHNRVEMIGFNNVHFDYVLLHHLLKNPVACTAEYLYQVSQRIFNNTEPRIWENERLIPQIDVFLINHFDNKARRTSLKALQFAMRSESIEDLPIAPGTILTPEQMDITLRYNGHDVTETKKFALKCSEQIEFRRKLALGESSLQLSGDVMNFNDTKIGKQYLIQQLGEEVCYTRVNGTRQPRQTHRASINIGEIILPYVRFNHPELKRIYYCLQEKTITQTKGELKLTCDVGGIELSIGTGGIHGSVNRSFYNNDEHCIIKDIDVTSLYPSIGIENNLYPEHLGKEFPPLYASMKEQRISYKKGTAENAMLKLALNGAYGDSNSIYSPFYDSKYTMSITINGQLSLCMLAEMISQVPTVELIQINTDGITVRMRKEWESTFDCVCKQWEQITRLTLESAMYRRMWIRDVNSYVAEYTDGKVKLKGAYWYPAKEKDYDGWWHKDYSALAVQKAVHTALIHGVNPADMIRSNADKFDFMLRAKVDRGTALYIGDQAQHGRITRYFISQEGLPIYTSRPPVEGATLGAYCKSQGTSWQDYNRYDPFTWNADVHTKNKSVYKMRETSLQDGWKVQECNIASKFDWKTLNYDWYIAEAQKLMIA